MFGLLVAEIFKKILYCSLYCKRERDNCQSGHVDCRYVWMVLDRNRCKNCFSARISGRTGSYLRKTSTSSCVGGVSLKRVLCAGSRRLSMDFVQLRGSGVSQETLSSLLS